MENRIGPFRFLDFAAGGMPQTLRSVLERIDRPGVDGTGIWDTGKHGQPFTLRSQTGQPDLATAADFYQYYTLAVDADPLDLVFRDQTFYDVLFQVLDVRLVEMCQLAGSAGGLGEGSPNLAWLECDWDLLAVPAATG